MSSIIATIFIGFAKNNSHSAEKRFPILIARVSEIAILFIRFTIKHSFQENSLLHCPLRRILVLEKRITDSCGKSF